MEIETKPVSKLIHTVDSCMQYFEKCEKYKELCDKLDSFKSNVDNCCEKVKIIESFASEYDFDENTPANGYRSFVSIFTSAIKKSLNLCQQMSKSRMKILFRANYYANEISEWSEIFYNLSKICSALIETHQNTTSKGNLILECAHIDNILARTFKIIDQKPFYSKNVGFYLCASIKPIVKFIVVAMASYFNYYYDGTHKILRGLDYLKQNVKYLSRPKKRAERCVHVFSKSTPEFNRSFWFLNEGKFMHPLANFAAPKVEVNKMFEIQPEELTIQSEISGELINIPLPISHTGDGPIFCRLISAKRRQGMLRVKPTLKSSPPSKNLIFHVHGGGFAAQTSKSHETYLKEWAAKLDAPILSIDYSLALQAPFPRALEEVFYTYCWALKNPELLGSTGENMVLVGDSAGGNLITACTIKCIELGIKKPKGLLNVYTVFKDCFAVTPSRFMTLIDTFLPYLFAYRLFKSYASETLSINDKDIEIDEIDIDERKKLRKGKPKNRHDSFEEEFSFTTQKSYLISVYDAPDNVLAQFPPTIAFTSNFDPFLDDSVEFSKKLKKLKVKTSVDIVEGLPHGFMYFSHTSKDACDAVKMCCKRLEDLLAN